MAVTYATAVKTARMQAVADEIDGGASFGKLKLRSSANVVLAVFTLTDPCGTVSGDTLTLDADPDVSTTGVAAGDATNAIVTDSDDNTKISGLTVGTSGADVIVSAVAIAVGQTVRLESAAFQHAA